MAGSVTRQVTQPGGWTSAGLTPRQAEALRCYARSPSYKEVATAMCLTVDGVRMLLGRAYDRLEVHSAIEAFAVLGWLQVPE